MADHLTVERPYERAVDALLGDWLQHVVVERAEDVTRGLALLAGRDAGRCGFLVLDEAASQPLPVAELDRAAGRPRAARASSTRAARTPP